MATLRRTTQPKTSKVARRYNQSAVYGWQASNKSALDIINEYQNKIQNGDWLSTEDRQKYKSAVDTYTSTGNSLRSASKHYGQKYTADEEKSWNDSLSSLQSGYSSVNDFYGQFANDKVYGNWKRYESPIDDVDYDKYVDIGKSTANPNWNQAHAPLDIGGWQPFGSGESVNNMVTFAEANKNAGAVNAMQGTGDKYSEIINLINQHMTPEEKSRYNYYVGKGDTAMANEYLDYMSDVLRQRAGGQIAVQADNNGLELLTSGLAGMQTAVSGYQNFLQGFVGGNDPVRTQALQYANQQTSENNKGIWKVMNDLANTTGNMAPSLVVGALTGGTAGAIAMGVSSAGNAYADMIQQGYSKNQARAYGLLTGASEAGLSYALGGISKLGGSGKGIFQSIAGKIVPQVNNGLARFAIDLGGNMADEALEEAAQTVLESVFKHAVTLGEEDISIDWGEVAYSGLLGALSAGTLEGVPSAIGTGIANYKANIANGGLSVGGAIQAAISKETKLSEAFKQGQATVTNFAGEYANYLTQLDADNKAAKYVQDRIGQGKNVSGYQINRLASEIDKALTNNDTTAVKKAVETRLTELGETGDVSAIADAIARETVGEELSFKDRAVLNKSTKANIVLTEMMPENIKGGNLANKWAEGIGTKRANADVYNLSKATVTPNTESSAEAKIAAPAGDVKAAIEQAAKDKVGKIDGFTEETANVMVKDYDGSVSPSEYVTTFDEAFKLGRDNAQVKELTRLSKESGVIGRALLHAYDAGLQSRNAALKATNSENSVLQNGTESGIINTESESITNEGKTGTKGIPLRRGGKRINGAYSEGQIPSVEGSAGQTASRGEARRIADSKGVSLYNTGREVRVADLGILNGSKQQKVRVIDNEADYTPSMKQAAADAKKQGLTAKFYVGDNILIEEANGSISGVRGYILGNTILVRADHEVYTSDQIARHEAGHDMIAKGQVNVKAVKKKLAEVVGKDNVEVATEYYAEAYDGSGLTTDELWEELICDSLGDMNIFARDKAQKELFDRFIPDAKKVVSELKTEAKSTEGVTEGKASRSIQKAKYLSYTRVGIDNVSYIKEQLQKIYGDIESGIADEIAIARGNKVFIVDSGRENGKIKMGVREILNFSDLALRDEYVRRQNDDAVSEGRVSDELSSKLKSKDDSGRKSNLRRESGSELQADKGKSEDQQGGVSGEDADQRGLTKGKASRELDVDSEGNELSPAVAKRFANSKVVDENGRLKVVYHGTPAGEFTIFDKSKGSVEGDFGSGFYFTDNEADVSANYEGGGPDFENKVWRRAEQIFDEDPDIQMDEAREQARAEMFKGSHKFEVYLNVENPAIVGETILFDPDSYAENYNEDDYDSYDDYIGDVEQLLVDDVDSIIWDIERNVDLYSNTDQIRNVLYDAYYEGGIDVQKLKDKISELYLESNDGEMVANEVARQIIESLGYDGIIDSTVSSKFKNMGMEEGTTHYIVFKPNQIKSITNQNPTDNPDIRYSRELDLIDYINEKAKVERANMTKSQLVAEVRSELEAMNVGKGELMAVQKVADKLFERYGGNASISEFRYAMLEATRLALKEEGFDAAYEVINEVAKEVAYNPKDLGGEAELLSQIQKDIRGTKLSVHEKDKTSGEFDNYGGYGAFRKRLFGKVNLVNDGQQVDAKYEELQNVYGKSFFPDVNTVSEQLMVIEEVMNTPLSDYMMVDETELSETADEMTMSLFTRLGDIWTKANEGVNVAVNKQKAGSPRELLANALENVTQNAAEKENLKKYKKEIDGLNEQERKLWDLKRQMWEKSFQNGTKDKAELRKLKDEITKTENRINLYDRRLLNLEATKALHDLVVREKKAAYKAAAEKGREALHRNVEGRHKSEARAKIKKLKQKFQSIIEHPTDRQYIPVDLMSAMIDVCDLIDTSSPLYKTDGSINKAQQARNEQAQRLLKLKAEYDKLAKSADYAIAYEYEQEIADYIQTIMTDYANKNIADMTLEQLTDLYQMMRSIEETLRDARRLIGWSDAMTVYEAGDSIIEEQAKIGEKRKQNGISEVDDSIVNLSLSPVRAVLRMAGYNEDSALYHSIREIENGTRQQKKFVMDAVKKFEGLTTGKNASTYEKAIYDPYGKELIDKNGQKFHVTKMQMMQAIMSYEREMANEKLHHVSNGGFTFADIKLLGKGEIREAVSAKYAHTITLGSDVAVKFMSELANDKWAQGYMAEARRFFDETAKEAINDANMKLKHRIVATGKNYIPYEVNSDFIVREINSENDIQQVISGYGMLKDLKEGASQPLIITGLNNVLDRHIEQVGNVAALAVPIRNFNKIWNVKSTDGSTTVREKIKSNWGVGGEDLITQAVKDVQGPRKKTGYKWFKTLKSNIISGTFIGNWSVVLKQIGSMFSSTSILNYRDPASMMVNLIATKANRDAIAAEVNKYTAVAWVRGQGLSDAELYDLKTTAKKSKLGRAVDKLPSALNAAKWITQMDYDVALSLWKYAKEDTAKRTGLKGEELLKATADYYNDVIENTQSMSDVLHRPEVQKRDDIASEMLGMFKTDLYQNAGLIRVALESRNAHPSAESNKALVKAVCGTLSSMCWSTLITSVMAAFRYKVNRYRDKEDDEIALENWLKVSAGDMAKEMFGYMMPLFGGEAAEIFAAWITGETYEFDNVTIEALNGLIKAFGSVASSFREGDDIEKIAKSFKNLFVKGTSLLGVPANNVARFIDAVRLHAQDIANGEFMSFEAGLTSPNNTRLYRAYIEGDADKINKASRLYKDEAALKAGLRKGLRENDPRLREAAIAKLNGDKDTYKRLLSEVIAEGKFDRTIVEDAFAAEYNYQKNKADEEGK